MAGYTTGVPELIQAGKNMEDANANLQSELSQLAGSVEGIAGAWKGSASQAFTTLMGRFQEDAKKLNDSLQNIAEQIAGSADVYQRQEEEAAQSISAITGALG
jgi:WXG100 family type VII secretion target